MQNVPMPDDVSVYIRGPEYSDRFLVVLPDNTVWRMSANPMSPRGVCEYECMAEAFRPTASETPCVDIPVNIAEKIEELRT